MTVRIMASIAPWVLLCAVFTLIGCADPGSAANGGMELDVAADASACGGPADGGDARAIDGGGAGLVTPAVSWLRVAGGDRDDFIMGRDTYDDGAVLIAAYLGGEYDTPVTKTFGAGEPGEVQITLDPSASNGAVAKLAASGDLDWLLWLHSPDSSEVSDVEALADGGAVVAGDFSTALSLGSGPTIELGHYYGATVIVRVDADGNPTWLSLITGPSCSSKALQITTTAAGEIVVIGVLTGTCVFGAGPDELVLAASDSNTGFSNAFVARYGLDGRVHDAKLLASDAATSGLVVGDLVPLADGGFALSGDWYYQVTLGPGEPGEITLPNPTNDQTFVAFYDGEARLQRVAGVRRGSTSLSATPDGVAFPVGSQSAVGWYPAPLTPIGATSAVVELPADGSPPHIILPTVGGSWGIATRDETLAVVGGGTPPLVFEPGTPSEINLGDAQSYVAVYQAGSLAGVLPLPVYEGYFFGVSITSDHHLVLFGTLSYPVVVGGIPVAPLVESYEDMLVAGIDFAPP